MTASTVSTPCPHCVPDAVGVTTAYASSVCVSLYTLDTDAVDSENTRHAQQSARPCPLRNETTTSPSQSTQQRRAAVDDESDDPSAPVQEDACVDRSDEPYAYGQSVHRRPGGVADRVFRGRRPVAGDVAVDIYPLEEVEPVDMSSGVLAQSGLSAHTAPLVLPGLVLCRRTSNNTGLACLRVARLVQTVTGAMDLRLRAVRALGADPSVRSLAVHDASIRRSCRSAQAREESRSVRMSSDVLA